MYERTNLKPKPATHLDIFLDQCLLHVWTAFEKFATNQYPVQELLNIKYLHVCEHHLEICSLLQGSIRYPVQELLTYELNIGKLRLYLHVCGHHL